MIARIQPFLVSFASIALAQSQCAFPCASQNSNEQTPDDPSFNTTFNSDFNWNDTTSSNLTSSDGGADGGFFDDASNKTLIIGVASGVGGLLLITIGIAVARLCLVRGKSSQTRWEQEIQRLERAPDFKSRDVVIVE